MRSSWPPERIGSRTRTSLQPRRTRLRKTSNEAVNPAPGSSPERTCILTRAKGDKDSLIRLALGPDGEVAPDPRARAPGRGAWIRVGRAELDAANAKGKLKAALQ